MSHPGGDSTPVRDYLPRWYPIHLVQVPRSLQIGRALLIFSTAPSALAVLPPLVKTSSRICPLSQQIKGTASHDITRCLILAPSCQPTVQLPELVTLHLWDLAGLIKIRDCLWGLVAAAHDLKTPHREALLSLQKMDFLAARYRHRSSIDPSTGLLL